MRTTLTLQLRVQSILLGALMYVSVKVKQIERRACGRVRARPPPLSYTDDGLTLFKCGIQNLFTRGCIRLHIYYVL